MVASSPYFLYAVIWWFPLIFIGSLLSKDRFKKENLGFLSPLCILQFPSSGGNDAFSPNQVRAIGMVIVFLCCVGTYQFWSENKSIDFFIPK